MSISKKFLAIIILATLIPTVSVGISVYYFLNNALKAQIGESFRDKLDFYRISLESKLAVLKENSASWTSNFVFMDILKRDEDLNIATYIKNLKDAHAIIRDIVIINYELGFVSSTDVAFMETIGESEEETALTRLTEQKQFVKKVTTIPFLNLKDVFENRSEYASLSQLEVANFLMLPIKNYFDEAKSLGVMIIYLNRSVLDDILLGSEDGSDSSTQKYNIYFSLERRLIFSVEKVFKMPFARIAKLSTATEKIYSLPDQSSEKLIIASVPLNVALRGYEGKLRITLAQPESLAFANVKKINGIVLLLGLIALSIFIPLGALFGKSISSPISKLKNLTEDIIVSGDLSKRLRVNTHDEIGSLTRAFNHLLSAVHDSRRKLEKYNESLELFVEERTKELRAVKYALSEMLNNMKQAILTFDDDLLVNSEYSSYLNILLEDKTPFAERNVLEVLSGSIKENKEEFRSKLDFYFSILMGAPKVQWEVMQEDLPHEVKISINGEDKDIKMTFEPIIGPDGLTTRIMVIMEDVTHLKKLQRIAAQKQADLERISELINLKGTLFERFYDESINIIYKLHAQFFNKKEPSNQFPAIDWQEFYRGTHTIKGNARLFSLFKLQDICHEIEGYLADLKMDGNKDHERVNKVMENVERLRDELFNYKRLFDELFGGESQGHDQGQLSFAAELMPFIFSAMTHLWRDQRIVSPELFQLVLMLKNHSQDSFASDIYTLMDCFKKEAVSIANDLNKKIRVSLRGDNKKLNGDQYRIVSNSLVHLVRNAIDHGIESVDQRIKAGKESTGTLLISWHTQDEMLKINIRDDGGGLNLEKIKEKAEQISLFSRSELENMQESQIRDLIFSPQFSLASKVSNLSGRGVGLDAVKNLVASSGGTIEVTSVLGNYTEFEIILPLENAKKQEWQLFDLYHEIRLLIDSNIARETERNEALKAKGDNLNAYWVFDRENEKYHWLTQFARYVHAAQRSLAGANKTLKIEYDSARVLVSGPTKALQELQKNIVEMSRANPSLQPKVAFDLSKLSLNFDAWIESNVPKTEHKVITMLAQERPILHRSLGRLNNKWGYFDEYIAAVHLKQIRNICKEKEIFATVIVDFETYQELKQDKELIFPPNILVYVLGREIVCSQEDEQADITFLDFADDVDEDLGFVIMETSVRYFHQISISKLGIPHDVIEVERHSA